MSTALAQTCAQSPDKAHYRNFAKAREVADRRQKVEGRPLYVYACSSCGDWHISKKKGDEHVARIGPGGLIHSSESGKITAPGLRDERFLKHDPSTQKIRDALRSHGNPAKVSPASLRQWTGLSYSSIRRVMLNEGWTAVGKTTKLVWHRPRLVPEAQPLAPLTPQSDEQPKEVEQMPIYDEPTIVVNNPTPEPKTLDLDVVGNMTIEQLRIAYLAAGMEIRVTVV